MTEPMVTTLSDFREHRARWAAASGAPTAAPALTLSASLAAPPPTGTVTFLLTDVEGSTPRWEAAPDAMTVAVARHYELLDAAVAAHGGVRPIEQGEGDSMVAVFAHASDALAAALRAQRALIAEPWPAGAEMNVRMALHTGEARLRDETYYIGPSIIRCARLRSLAHGRQVVVSATTAALVADDLPDGAELVPLGLHRLKGMGRPERVLQLAHPHLPATFPALAAADTRLRSDRREAVHQHRHGEGAPAPHLHQTRDHPARGTRCSRHRTPSRHGRCRSVLIGYTGWVDLPAEARKRIETDEIAWLTTVTDSGAPAPNPVWFVPDGEDLLVFAQPGSGKARNIAARPRVTLHFETRDPAGSDVIVIHGSATLEHGVKGSVQPGYLAKYAAVMPQIEFTVEDLDNDYDTCIRITPSRVRVGL
jgi:PPOX class probable F420-dependent enzyme